MRKSERPASGSCARVGSQFRVALTVNPMLCARVRQNIDSSVCDLVYSAMEQMTPSGLVSDMCWGREYKKEKRRSRKRLHCSSAAFFIVAVEQRTVKALTLPHNSSSSNRMVALRYKARDDKVRRLAALTISHAYVLHINRLSGLE